MIHIEKPSGASPERIHGVNVCPGIDERGHGLTMRILHDGTCCTEWATGETPWARRAAEWRKIAERRGTTWPLPGTTETTEETR